MSIDRGEPIPPERFQGLSGTCPFCHGGKHYGWCDPMRAEWSKAVEEGRGRPVPITRC